MRASGTRRCFRPSGFVVAVLFCISVLPVATNATSPPPLRKNVLIINEVSLTHSASALITQELMSRLAASGDYQVEFYVASLDSALLTDERSRREVESIQVQQYQNYKLDVIVAMGPSAIKFLSRVSGTFHPEVPIVICCSSEEQAGHPTLGSRFTGSWMKIEPAMTVGAALKLVPGTRHVVIVGGSSPYDKGVEAITRASLSSYAASIDLNYLTDLDMSSLLNRLRHLPPHTIVLYMSLFRDAAGNQFVNATTALPLVSVGRQRPCLWNVGCVSGAWNRGRVCDQL